MLLIWAPEININIISSSSKIFANRSDANVLYKSRSSYIYSIFIDGIEYINIDYKCQD